MKYFFVALFFLFNSLFGQTGKPIDQSLSDKDKSSIKVFLRVLMEESEGGYVFFNKKPVCIHGYNFIDPFIVNTDIHKEMVALKEAASVWKKINKEKSDIIIHFCQNKDPKIPGVAHVLVINTVLFHKVVNKNLSLFQYILGPAVTSSSLLDALIHEDQPFHYLLKYDKVLIGILLGFETQNSIYASRVENIYEACATESPPFLPINLIKKEFIHEYVPFSPSFGFKTSQEEYDDFTKKLTVSSHKLTEKKPNFIFGWLKNKASNKKLISELEEVQDKIQNLIKSKNFEMYLLKELTGKKYSINSHDLNLLKINTNLVIVQPSPPIWTSFKGLSNAQNNSTKELGLFFFCKLMNLKPLPQQLLNSWPEQLPNKANKIIAKGIWESLRNYDLDQLVYFLEGMDKPDFQKLKVERLACSPYYLKDFIEAKENLEAANIYFQSLNNNKDYRCIDPLRLYYKTLENNENNKTICNGSVVNLTYSIYSQSGHCHGHGSNELINLKNTITGFAHGVKGMLIGETREILIHPSLAYGFDASSLDLCSYLKAIVTLNDVDNEEPIPEIQHKNLDFLLDAKILKMREDNYKNGLRIKGAVIASHLKKNNEINISKIKDYLTEFFVDQNRYITATVAEQDFINQFHWNIYFGPKPD